MTGITESGLAEEQIGLVNIRGSWGSKMFGKCATSSCSASSRYLGEGMLFRLESDPAPRLSTAKAPECYWLCPTCSAAMTLHIDAEGKVVTAPLTVGVKGSRTDVVPMSNLRCRLREPNGDRITDPPKEAHHAL